MNVSMYLLSIIAMLCFGCAFFLLARTAKSIGTLQATFLFQLIGLPFIIFALPFADVPALSIKYLVPLFIGIADAFVFLIFLQALKTGKISIVTPIIDTYGLFTFLFGVLFLHESIVPFKVFGSMLIIFGLICISAKLSKSTLKEAFAYESGSGYALLGSIGTGLFFLAVGISVQQVGWFVNALLVRIGIIVTTLALLLFQKRNFLSLFKNAPLHWIVPAGILDLCGFILFNIAVTQGEVSTVTMITSAQTLVAVLLGFIVLKEKISKLQLLGIGMTFGGLICLNLM